MVRDPEVPGGERAKILDFGIAKLSDNAGVKTQTNAIMGTPQYMSPEQCRGSGKVDARSDVYALGCVMTTLITGEPPFNAEGPGELIVMHMQQPAPTLASRVPHVPPTIDAVVMRCLAKDVNERFASAAELAQALATLITSTSQPPGASMPALGPMQATIALPSPTTLTGAAGQAVGTLPPPQRSRKGLIFGIAGVLVAGAGIAGLVVAKGGSQQPATHEEPGTHEVAAKSPEPAAKAPDTAPAPAATTPASPTTPTTPTTPNPAEAKPARPTPAEAPPPAVPAKVAITIDSKPSNAQVFVGGDKAPRGTTPYVLELDKGSAPVEIKLVAKGYAPKKATVTPGKSTNVALTLDKVHVAAPAHTDTHPAVDTSPANTDDTMNPFAKKK
jgi:serine/threonine-protein kinase